MKKITMSLSRSLAAIAALSASTALACMGCATSVDKGDNAALAGNEDTGEVQQAAIYWRWAYSYGYYYGWSWAWSYTWYAGGWEWAYCYVYHTGYGIAQCFSAFPYGPQPRELKVTAGTPPANARNDAAPAGFVANTPPNQPPADIHVTIVH